MKEELKTPSFKLFYGCTPLGSELYGLLSLKIEQHHHGITHTPHFMVVDPNKTLAKGKAAVTDANYCRLYVNNLVLSINLLHEISIKMHGDNGTMLQQIRAHLVEVVHFCRVVILEVHSVVDMPEGIGIHPAQLDGHGVMVFDFFAFHILSIFTFFTLPPLCFSALISIPYIEARCVGRLLPLPLRAHAASCLWHCGVSAQRNGTGEDA